MNRNRSVRLSKFSLLARKIPDRTKLESTERTRTSIRVLLSTLLLHWLTLTARSLQQGESDPGTIQSRTFHQENPSDQFHKFSESPGLKLYFKLVKAHLPSSPFVQSVKANKWENGENPTESCRTLRVEKVGDVPIDTHRIGFNYRNQIEMILA